MPPFANDFLPELSKPLATPPAPLALANDFAPDIVIPQGGEDPNEDPMFRGARRLMNGIGRGWESLMQGVDLIKATTGLEDVGQTAKNIAYHDWRQRQFPLSAPELEAQQRAQGLEGWDAAFNFLTDTRLWPSALGGSIPAMGAPIVGGVAGGAAGGLPGALGGAYLGSFSTDFALTVLDELRARGGDPGDAASVQAALSDPEVWTSVRQLAIKHAVPVGLFDAASMGLAGRVFGPVARTTGSKVLGAGAEAATGATLGMTGEATGQIAQRGEITDPAAIAAEGLLEAPGAAFEAAGNVMTGVVPRAQPALPDDFMTEPMQAATTYPTTGTDDTNVQIANPDDFALPNDFQIEMAPTPAYPAVAPEPEPVIEPPEAASVDTPPVVPSASEPVAPVASTEPVEPEPVAASSVVPNEPEPAPEPVVPEPEPVVVPEPEPVVVPEPEPEAPPPQGQRAAPNKAATLSRYGHALRTVETSLTGTAASKRKAKDTLTALRNKPPQEDETDAQYRIGDEITLKGSYGRRTIIGVEDRHRGAPAHQLLLHVMSSDGKTEYVSPEKIAMHGNTAPENPAPPLKPWWHGSKVEGKANPDGLQPGDTITTKDGVRGTVAGVWQSKHDVLGNRGVRKPVHVAFVPEGESEGTYKTTGIENVQRSEATAAPAMDAPARMPAAAPREVTQDDVNRVVRSKEYKAVLGATTNVNSDTKHYAHPESPVAFERVRGWLDGQDGVDPEDQTAGSPGAINPYMEGYMAGRFGDALVVRNSYAGELRQSVVDGRYGAAKVEDEKADANPAAAEPDELRDDRRPTGTLAPQTEDVSMTKGRSIYEEAYRAAGLDPDEGVLLPPAQKLNVLKRVLVDTFGFRVVDTAGANLKDAANQMLDAFRNVRFMMHALALPVQGVSLNGTLGLHLEKAGKRYFGVYRPATHDIGLPGRSNSFAHEWAHALDHYLGDQIGSNAERLLSHITRDEGLDPNVSLENAFINLLHTMFFDDAALAAKALQLEIEAAAVHQTGPKQGQPTVAALDAQKKLERLKAGATRINLPDSEFRARSIQYDPGNPYWASVHEMLARAFEAYVASKVEALGGTNEFITKGEAAYLSDADRRLDLTFPKGINRDAIFAAFDDVIHHIRNQSILGTGPGAARPDDVDIVDPQYWNKVVLAKGNPKTFDAVRAEATAVRNAAQSALAKGLPQTLKDGVSHIATNAGINAKVDPRKIAATFFDTVRFVTFSLRGAIRPRIARNKGRGAVLMQEVFDRFATTSGDGRWHGMTYEDARQQESAKDINKIEMALRGNGFEKLTLSKADNDTARELLFGKRIPGVRPELVKVAAALRRVMEDAHTVLEKAGISVGYVTDKGYLPRVLNPTKVQTDPKGFQRDAEKLYRVVFDNLTRDPKFGPDEALGLAREVNQRLGDTTGVSRFDAEETALRAALKKLAKAADTLDQAIRNKASPGAIQTARQAAAQAASAVRAAQADLLRVLRDPFAEVSAIDWRTRVQIGDSVTYDSHGPASTFTKNRTLPSEADDIMAEWYNTDVVNLAANYVQQVHARAAYVQRAGSSSGTSRIQDVMSRKDVQNRMNANSAAQKKYGVGLGVNDMSEAQRLAIIKDFANTKTDNVLEMLYSEAERSGADAGDIKALRGAVETMTGRGDRAPLTDYYNRLGGFIYAYTYLRLLPRAAITSLTEPVSVLLRTGSLDAMFKTFTAYLGELNQQAQSVQERQAIARAIGLTTSPLYDTILMSRMGMDHGHLTSGNILLANFFKANFLTGITNAQRRSVMAGGFQWMRDMAQRHGNTDPAHKRMIEAEFRELGVRDADMDSFMDWLKQGDTLPDLGQLNSKAGAIFENAIHRLTGQIIQDPRRADKPMPASTPLGRVLYALTAYLYAFFSNVHAATLTRAVRNYRIGRDVGLSKGEATANAVAPAAMSFVGGFAMLFMGQLLVGLLRESLFNGEQWEKHRKAGDLLEWLGWLSVSRTGIYGPGDLIANSLTGLKYERDLANLMVGPGFSSIFSDLQNLLGVAPWAENSRNTNTAERNAAKGFYRLVVAPLLSGVLTSLDVAGPIGSGARYSAMIAVTSNAAASKFADMLAGEQKRLKKGDPGYVKPSE